MQSMADRYTYLPGLGPFLIAGVGAIRGFEKASKQRTATAAFISGAVIILVLLCAATVNRIGIWRDGFTLWSHVIEKEPRRVPVAYYNRGVVYHENGNLTKAVEDYTAAIALSPGYTHAFNNRGIAYDQLGQHDSAIKDFSMAISLKPDYVEAYANRGVGYRGMGLYDMALNDFNKAIDINPNYDKAFFNRGGVFYLKGEYERAVRDIDRSIELNPANSHAYIIRQNIYAKMRSEAPSSSR
jgi:tetratricopeptide (TPR) repeat protein